MKKIIAGMMAALCVGMAQGAGFGIYEASARGNAMGGAIVGDVDDATANYHNPANLAFATNIQVATGFTFINPQYDPEINHVPQNRMNSGWFAVPTFYLTVPLPGDFTFGWGNYTEYGLGSEYKRNWSMAADTQMTKIEQSTLNPNLAYKITDWWSVAAGIRGSWIHFKSYSQPLAPYQGYPGVYDLQNRIDGNDWAWGWNVATTLKPTDKWDIGVEYRSQIDHKIKGNQNVYTMIPGMGRYVMYGGRASARLRLPPSVVFGTNYKFTDRFRGGAAITYTRWSTLETIRWHLPSGDKNQKFNWHDTLRVGFGLEYDLLDWMQVRCGYTFDEDPTSKTYESTMLPGGDRHIFGMGLGFKVIDNLRLDVSYNFIRMNNEHYYINYTDGNKVQHRDRFSTRNGVSHLIGATVTYEF